MRVGYLSADFGVPVFGDVGNSIHVRELVEALRRAGHAVHICSPALDVAAARGPNAFRADGPPVALTPVPWEPGQAALFRELEELDDFLGMKTRVRHELRNLLYNRTLHRAATAAFSAWGADVVYERYAFAATAGLQVAADLHLPHLLEVNAPLTQEQEERAGVEMKALAAELETRIFRGTGALLAVSKTLADYAVGLGVRPERVSVLPNAVDLQRFVAADPLRARVRDELSVSPRCVVSFVGALKPWHGTEVLLEAFDTARRRRPDLHLLIVGQGPLRASLEREVERRELGGVVSLLGAVSHERVPGLLAASDVCVAPFRPHANFYFSPLKLFEYMASGRAVVAGAIGQVAEVLRDDENGRLFPVGDAEALARVLVELAGDGAARERLGAAARRCVAARHTWDRNAERVVALADALRGEP